MGEDPETRENRKVVEMRAAMNDVHGTQFEISFGKSRPAFEGLSHC